MKKLNVNYIKNMKKINEPITAITSYDYPFAQLADQADIDIILVGDSGGMVKLGYENTIPTTMEEMLTMCKSVSRATQRAFIIADMPFLSYQISETDAVKNAGRFIKEGGADAVKLEGGQEYSKTVRSIVKAGIPVMGHIGLKPQTAKLWKGYTVQGNDLESAKEIIEDAYSLEHSGAFSIVLEMVTTEVSEIITNNISIPTIGIGSGPHCNGQILVINDMLGLYQGTIPKFVKKYNDLNKHISKSLISYKDDVIKKQFPSDDNCFRMEKSEFMKLKNHLHSYKNVEELQ